MGLIFDIILLAVVIGLFIALINGQSKLKEFSEGNTNSNQVVQEGFHKMTSQVKQLQLNIQRIETRIDAMETRLYMMENGGEKE